MSTQTPNQVLDLLQNPEELEAYLLAVHKMNKDLLLGMETVSPGQARFVVDLYYQMQKFRIDLQGQIRSQKKDGEPVDILKWYKGQFLILENQTKNALHKYAKSSQAGRWALSIDGIGPVIAAGLLAHIQPDRDNPKLNKRMNNPSKLQRFAGYDPTVVWGKGEKRPWNAKLKTLGYKLGESFVKLQGKEGAFYPPFFTQFKAEEVERNDSGKNTPTAIRDQGAYKKETNAWAWVNGCYPAGMSAKLMDIPNRVPMEILVGEKAKTKVAKKATKKATKAAAKGSKNLAKKLEKAEKAEESISKKRSEWIAKERERLLEEELLEPGKGQPMLPPSQVHSRARRRLVKIFLTHMWQEIWVEKYAEEPVRPWIFVHGGHSTEILRPNPSLPTHVPTR